MSQKKVKGLEFPALSRPFKLGGLYDSCSDAIIQDITLWPPEALEKAVHVKPQHSSKSNLIPSDSIKKKDAALSLPASLQASVLSELIDLQGSARYWKYRNTFRKGVQVTLHYKASMRYEELVMEKLKANKGSSVDVTKQGSATHVVTGLMYGVQVFLVFDLDVLPSEEKEDLQDKLTKLVKNNLMSTGNQGLKCNVHETVIVERVNCRAFTDLRLPKETLTFTEAYDLYHSLKNGPPENDQKVVPIKVWLQPLTMVDPKAPKPGRELREGLVESLQGVINHLEDCEARSIDMMRDDVVHTFPLLKKKFQHFRKLCQEYKLCLQRSLSRLVPLARRSEKEENVLQQILAARERSPFSKNSLDAWINDKTKEMTTIQSYLKLFNGLQVMSSEKQLEEEVLNPHAEYLLCFVFTSLDQEEPYLSELEKYCARQTDETTADQQSEPYDYANQVGQRWFQASSGSKKARKCARFFAEFAEANKNSKITKFAIASVPNKDHPGVTVYFYEEGVLQSTDYEPPSKPAQVQITHKASDGVTLQMQAPKRGCANILNYRVHYRALPHGTWNTAETKGKEENLYVGGLLPDQRYEFKSSGVSLPGVSQASDTSEIGTLKTGNKEKLSLTAHPSSHEELSADEYDTENEHGEDWHHSQSEECDESEMLGYESSETLDSSIEDSCKNETKQADDETVCNHVTSELALRIRSEMSRPVTFQNASKKPQLFQLSLEEKNLDASGHLRKASFGERGSKPNKNILVVGASGAGKTMLINAMINYILGIEWADDFRFILKEEELRRSQTESQTPEVTAYTIHHMEGFQIPFSLTIIDTPGFGSTKGIKEDENISRLIRDLFTQHPIIHHIDAICFVTPASVARVTHTQQYIFDAITSVFGKDVAQNLVILTTFSDAQKPPVLEAITNSKVPYAKDADGTPVFFRFNSSSLYASSSKSSGGRNKEQDGCSFEKIFWQMGSHSFKNFFLFLSQTKARSLALVNNALKERKQLEVTTEGWRTMISSCLCALDELRATRLALEQHQNKMEEGENFEYEVETTKPVREPLPSGHHIKNCMNCQFKCGSPFSTDRDAENGRFPIHDSKGNCSICPNKCTWKIHFDQKYKWTYQVTKEKKEYREVKERFEREYDEVMTADQILACLQREITVYQGAAITLIQNLHRDLQKINKMGAQRQIQTVAEYINLMIESEQFEGKPGYEGRIQSLREIQKQDG
ncbi:uncharacterized protein LOC120540079 [Polypterus senegalus]|uniref:uncharacterized protein LOC120540079 n=1 Tax=Polypterus senegalus TaxID=55291 RepID=UPI001965CCA0|nr:uncharacterized protein LOC120540079 [Polypterus senegalus]